MTLTKIICEPIGWCVASFVAFGSAYWSDRSPEMAALLGVLLLGFASVHLHIKRKR